MKDERNVRHSRAEDRRRRLAAMALAAVIALVSLPLFGKNAFAAASIDLSNKCSLTIQCSADDQEMAEANVVVDLYRIADARIGTPTSEFYDTWHWVPVPALEGVLDLPEDTDREGWKAVTEEVSDLILGPAPEGRTLWNPEKEGGAYKATFTGDKFIGSQPLGTKVEGLEPGIYFLVPRGKDVLEYAGINHNLDSSDDEETEEADFDYMTKTVTLAKSSRYTYQFAPELVALPTKEEWEGEINTGNPGEWVYDAEVVLKPSQRGVGGDLEIVKMLDHYEYREKMGKDILETATAVFEVKVYENKTAYETRGDEALILHKFVSIAFNNVSGQKTAIIEDLPMHSYAVVTEVYSGQNYEAVMDTTETVEIKPDETATVTFENEYDGRNDGGGSITNHFTFDGSRWTVEQVTDNSTEQEHIGYPDQEDDSNE